MKTYKSIDLAMQLILLALVGVAYISNDPEKFSPIFIVLAYAAVQIISIIVNLGAGPRPWKKASLRKYHLIGTALVLAAIAVAFLQDAFRGNDDKYSMPGLSTLVYATIPAILMALFYTVITWIEWKKMKKEV